MNRIEGGNNYPAWLDSDRRVLDVVNDENGEPLVLRRYVNAVNILLCWVGIAAIISAIWYGVAWAIDKGL